MRNERQQQDDVPAVLLRGDDLEVDIEPGVEEHRREGQAHRDLVGDHLRAGAQPAEQRVGRAGGPAGQHDAVDADRGDRQDEEHRDRQVGQLQRGAVAEDRHLVRGPNGITANAMKAGIAEMTGARM